MNCGRRASRQILLTGLYLLAGLLCLQGIAGCGGGPGRAMRLEVPAGAAGTDLSLLGHTIQVGAFAGLENAVRLMESLNGRGLDAYYFRHESGLYKVRFGNFPSREAALLRARALMADGMIADYYIVDPADFAAAEERGYGGGLLRDHLVRTARKFIGIPYRWGGSSPEDGFDCSGLAMTVYRMNGLNLPRNSRAQYHWGMPVADGGLKPGDLVFFAADDGEVVSHVGIYTGEGSFIHAPGEGKEIRTASLNSSYFRRTYIGARSYLRTED